MADILDTLEMEILILYYIKIFRYILKLILEKYFQKILQKFYINIFENLI